MTDMRAPSSRVLINVADVYSATPGQDRAGGASFNYPTVPTVAAEPCSAQLVSVREIDENDRAVTRLRDWEVMFGRTLPVNARDMLVITDLQGVQHTAFVHDIQDQAGRGSAFVVYAEERL